ncbi:MAG: formylglycine-generating enzyme family protein [Bacteroidetes bacterium]|nr:formylglycine-generating enzyme family protein [Bacteroidota bacterium]
MRTDIQGCEKRFPSVTFAVLLAMVLALNAGCAEKEALPVQTSAVGDDPVGITIPLVDTLTADSSRYVFVAAGSFLMGDINDFPEPAGARPVHEVRITRSFLIGRTEVTQKQYRDIMGENSSVFIGDDLPVNNVTWYEAVAYCNALSAAEGLTPCYTGHGDSIVCDWDANGYRLPTEAEWEYACRAGLETDYSSGDMTWPGPRPLDSMLNEVGWYYGNSQSVQPVGKKHPNRIGLYDMHGNIREWCWDWFIHDCYSLSPAADPRGPAKGDWYFRVQRSGSVGDPACYCRSSSRMGYMPYYRCGFYGFRVVRLATG